MRTKKILLVLYIKHLYIFFIFLSVSITAFLFLKFLMYDTQNGSDTGFTNVNGYISSVNTNFQKPKLAIIIDDFGQNRNGVNEMMALNRHLTFAIMPFLDYSRQDALNAHKKGYEVILHLPMQSQKEDIQSWLGPRPVKLSFDDSKIRKITLDSIDAIPYISGVNIHMGALASENQRVVTSVMTTVKEKGLYFVDSVTSPRTKCKSVAQKLEMRFIQRDVFLESNSENKTKKYIKKQLSAAGDLALKTGYAVAIGHVGSAGGKITAESIKEMIPELEGKGIEFVFVSELFN